MRDIFRLGIFAAEWLSHRKSVIFARLNHGIMATFNEQEKELAIDIIAEKLNEVIERRVDSLHSIDILSLAVDIVDSFDTIFSFIVHTTEIAVICKGVMAKLNKAGIPANEEDVKVIIKNISETTGRVNPEN